MKDKLKGKMTISVFLIGFLFVNFFLLFYPYPIFAGKHFLKTAISNLQFSATEKQNTVVEQFGISDKASITTPQNNTKSNFNLQNNGNRAIIFNSLVSMLKDTNLKVGMTVRTLGYYAANDGGGALYIIRSAVISEIYDNGSLIQLNNGNVAELTATSAVTPIQFGAYGDGAHDDTVAIQNAINYAEVIDGLGKTYLINPNKTLISPSTQHYGLYITKSISIRNGCFKLADNVDIGICCFGINSDGRTTFENVTIDGNADNQSIRTDGRNHGIMTVHKGKEGVLHIRNCTIKNMITDGIMHRSGFLRIEKSTIINKGRNGITCDKNAMISDSLFYADNPRRAPYYCVDCEPNEGYGYRTRLYFERCGFTKRGIIIAGNDSTSVFEYLDVHDCYSLNDKNFSVVIHATDEYIDTARIYDNRDVSIYIHAKAIKTGENDKCYVNHVELVNNTGNHIQFGNASAKGVVNEVIIKDTNYENNQIKFLEDIRKLTIENCTFDQHSLLTGAGSFQLYWPNTTKKVNQLIIRDSIFRNCGAAVMSYQLTAANTGDIAEIDGCRFENMGTVLRSAYKKVSISNSTFSGISNYGIRQGNLNHEVMSANNIFNQTPGLTYSQCGSVNDVNCVYNYTEPVNKNPESTVF